MSSHMEHSKEGAWGDKSRGGGQQAEIKGGLGFQPMSPSKGLALSLTPPEPQDSQVPICALPRPLDHGWTLVWPPRVPGGPGWAPAMICPPAPVDLRITGVGLALLEARNWGGGAL